MSKTTTIAKMRRDGTVVEVLADGTDRQEHGDRGAPLSRGPVADDDDVGTPARRALRRPA